ncbi:uncharacterized protein K452DRAFT_290536 [Aplosporella prunicola CBS 121167]|uniref:Uncharacterized protein n=1 Tax=Aplosporella prunicola CBS 121167 TaxID=1176127 RepID=A0A6A6B4U9_9PEZI|nr:uncharacterized protein K452DRAFT_290536 [Aplosporella prunicola CBS 121167]KAF2138886.1 hypothetical protein K452DRAFT_290536 [Aplosporella prunicola CBS 121167]
MVEGWRVLFLALALFVSFYVHHLVLCVARCRAVYCLVVNVCLLYLYIFIRLRAEYKARANSTYYAEGNFLSSALYD